MRSVPNPVPTSASAGLTWPPAGTLSVMEKNATTDRAQVHAFVDRSVGQKLHGVARANDRSLAAEIRGAISEHIEREGAASGARSNARRDRDIHGALWRRPHRDHCWRMGHSGPRAR